MSHPEMGHILVRRHLEDNYEGKCPYHGDCFEGLAAGPAIEGRWGKKANELADRNEVWKLEAYYIAQALVQYILVLSPKRIILGGGIMKQTQIFPLIHKYIQEAMNGYVEFQELEAGIADYIVSPGLGDNAGIVGSLMLAERALQGRGKI
jgi:fructokinase